MALAPEGVNRIEESGKRRSCREADSSAAATQVSVSLVSAWLRRFPEELQRTARIG